MQVYKLREGIVGIDSVVQKGRQRLISIPAGSVLTLPLRPLQGGIVEVDYEGRTVGVFFKDLRDRSEAVQRQEVS